MTATGLERCREVGLVLTTKTALLLLPREAPAFIYSRVATAWTLIPADVKRFQEKTFATRVATLTGKTNTSTYAARALPNERVRPVVLRAATKMDSVRYARYVVSLESALEQFTVDAESAIFYAPTLLPSTDAKASVSFARQLKIGSRKAKH